MSRHMSDFFIEFYGMEEVSKLPMNELLKAFWFFSCNTDRGGPINEEKIREIFEEYDVRFKELQ